jgi:hypothetical protein
MFPHSKDFLLVYSTNQRYAEIPGFPTIFGLCFARLFHCGDIAGCSVVYNHADAIGHGSTDQKYTRIIPTAVPASRAADSTSVEDQLRGWEQTGRMPTVILGPIWKMPPPYNIL